MKTTRILIAFLFCSLVYSAYAQTITESDYYDVLNHIKIPDSKGKILLSSDPSLWENDTDAIFHNGFSVNANKPDTIFTLADKAYIRQQVKQAITTKWDNKNITWAKVIPHSDIHNVFTDSVTKGDKWELFEKKFHESEYYDYSVPVFSVDKNTCAIYVGHHCGWLCGDGDIYIFRKKNNKWVLISTIGLWVS